MIITIQDHNNSPITFGSPGRLRSSCLNDMGYSIKFMGERLGILDVADLLDQQPNTASSIAKRQKHKKWLIFGLCATKTQKGKNINSSKKI